MPINAEKDLSALNVTASIGNGINVTNTNVSGPEGHKGERGERGDKGEKGDPGKTYGMSWGHYHEIRKGDLR